MKKYYKIIKQGHITGFTVGQIIEEDTCKDTVRIITASSENTRSKNFNMVNLKNATYFEPFEMPEPKFSIGEIIRPYSDDNTFLKIKRIDIKTSKKTDVKFKYKVDVIKKSHNYYNSNELNEEDFYSAKLYWFVNSEGELHSAVDGINFKGDEFRKKTGNYFQNKEDCEKYKHFIENKMKTLYEINI